MAEVLRSLRKLDFPEVVQEALKHLSASYSQGDNNIPGLGGGSEDVAQQIVNDFVLPKGGSGKGRSFKKWNAVQELQVQEIIVQFYMKESNESTQQAIFRHLFIHVSVDSSHRTLLYRLLSLAVGVQCSALLDTAAVWMQIHGCKSDTVCQLTEMLVCDYLSLVVQNDSLLRCLPDLSENFTCSLLASATSLYQLPGNKNNKKVVPLALLEIITGWLEAHPTLGLVSLRQIQSHPQRSTLWTSPTKSNTQTPIPNLVRWCTKAPLLLAKQDNKSICEDTARYSRLFSQLHLCTLQAILAFPALQGAAQLELITLVDMRNIVRDMTGLVSAVASTTGGDVAVGVSGERLVQVVQVALSTGAFRCSLADLKTICGSIPPNRLLSMLEKQHLSSAPPQMHNVP